MATTRFSFTFSTTDPTPFGPFPRWFVGQDPMLVAALNEALMTASRGDWLHFVLERVRDRLGGRTLDFLFQDPYSHQPELDESKFLLTAITPVELPAAIALVDAWLASICSEPEILATACERDVEFVREQLASVEPNETFQSVSEDGDEPVYLLGFLQSLRDKLVRACAAGETTIHVRLG
jgi:hypothetical protein